MNVVLYSSEVEVMEFAIQLKSAQDVQDFVCLASTRPFPVQVTNHQHSVNATNFMEMFALDVSSILFVSMQCSEEEFHEFMVDAGRFLAW